MLHYITSGNLLWRFCVSWMGGTGGGGWVNPEGANSMARLGLALEMPCLTPGGSFLSFLA